MKEIVVISGKGGTGKTSITASFSMLAGDSIVTADCDVDAADMHLLLAPDFGEKQAFQSGKLAVIDKDACIGCGKCQSICRYNAISEENMVFSVEPLDCEGCGYCSHICPVEAIGMEEQTVGECYRSTLRTGGSMAHARLYIGAENSGKLVAEVKKQARALAEEQNKDLVLVDGSPGIGCPVVSSLSGADYIVFVTEPTVSGIHDLRRVQKLVKQFEIPAGCILNKADLNPDKKAELDRFMEEEGIDKIAEIPFDPRFTEALTQGKTIVETDSPTADILRESWEKVKEILA